MLLARLKGDESNLLLKAVEEAELSVNTTASSSFLSPPTETKEESEETPTTQKSDSEALSKQKQLIKEKTAKIFKQHQEIVKLRDELRQNEENRLNLENDLKSRTEELYKANEKCILLEYQTSNKFED